MKESLLNINKTKYRYLMDNMKLFPIKPIKKYTVPAPKKNSKTDSEFYDRNYPDTTILNIKLKRMIDDTAKALAALGVKKGDIVTMCQTNTPENTYMDYAISKIGAATNYIYPNVTAEEMKYYINELDSKFMFILDDAPIRKNVKEATQGTGVKIISSSPIESFPMLFKKIAAKNNTQEKIKIENEISWENFIKNGKGTKVEEASYEPNTVCSYIHTSGTSSVPKAVMITNENINSIPRNYELDGITWTAGDIAVQTIPDFVQYGNATTHMYLCNNICVVTIPEMDPKNYYDLMKKYKPQYSFATPSHARELIKRPVDMSNAKIIGFGGDGFDDIEKLMNKYIKDNGGTSDAYQGYGSTEISAVAIVNTPKIHKVGSLGKPSGEIEAIIVEPGTFNVIEEPNKVGELCLTGPGVTKGYAGNSKDETKKVYVKHPDGKTYVHMGDYISFDEDGYYYYHGRIKNVITRKSFTFSPDEIVKAINKHPNVKQCIVVPKYSKEEGETPSAHIELKNYSTLETTMSEIIKLVNDNVQEFHRPTDYKIRTEIPITRNNKNNITALKIEDTAMLFPGVLEANITPLNDGENDYQLDIECNQNLINCADENVNDEIDNFINKISRIVKFNPGKIKYNVKLCNLKYSDSEKDKRQTYVKHI